MDKRPVRLHLTTDDTPLATVPRAVGKTNIGLYCNQCGEFISFAVEPYGAPPIEFVADKPLLIRCPFCSHTEDRHVAEIRRMPLTEANKQRR